MPYYKNGSLKSLIDKKFLTVRETLRYSIQFLSGLNNIHSKKLMHFDIKPDNILLSDSDEALLSDFGLAKAMDNFGFANPDGVYPKQVPPEFFLSTDKTIQFDIYLAGLTIYRLLNGNTHYNSQFAFPDQNSYVTAIKNGSFPNRDSYLPHVPIKLQRVVNKALNIDLNKRHKNVLELINELSDVDQNLDWRYEPNGTSVSWNKELDDRTYTVTIDKTSTNNLNLTTIKSMHGSGKQYRVKDDCHTNLTNNNVKSKLKKALKNS